MRSPSYVIPMRCGVVAAIPSYVLPREYILEWIVPARALPKLTVRKRLSDNQ